MQKILLVEDDASLSRNIQEALTADGYEVTTVYDGLLAERLLKKEPFDLLILDVNLPGKSGFDLCAFYRSFNADNPVIMLTAFDELDDKVKGFELGATDYLTKPFYMRELLLRIKVQLQKSDQIKEKNSDKKWLLVDDIKVDLKSKSVFRADQEISLTPREYQILVRLLKSNGELIPKKELIQEIWGRAFDSNTNTIEVYINFLRNKIDKPFGKKSIRTKVGYGYYFESEPIEE